MNAKMPQEESGQERSPAVEHGLIMCKSLNLVLSTERDTLLRTGEAGEGGCPLTSSVHHPL